MERLRSRSALPPGLQVSASLIVSEAVYFPMSVSQASDTVPGDQICLSTSQPVFVRSLYVRVLCVCVCPTSSPDPGPYQEAARGAGRRAEPLPFHCLAPQLF